MTTAARFPETAGDWASPVDPNAIALDILGRHGEHSSAFLTYNQDTKSYRTAVDGQIAYRPTGRRHIIQLCGPMAQHSDKRRLLTDFRGWAARQGRLITAVQLQREDALLYAQSGFVVNQLGTSYSIGLEGYTLRGTHFMKIRNKISRAKRQGVAVEELGPAELADARIQSELDEIDAHWLRGKRADELAFMIGERGGRGQAHRRFFLARHDGHPVAYVTYSPCYGQRPGWLYDLTRRRPTAPTGTIELLFHTALSMLQSEGCAWLHLGMTPFVGLSDEHELAGRSSPIVRATVRQIASRGEFLYPAASQEAFKLKWKPQDTEPEYIAFDRRVTVGAIWQLLRLTRTIGFPPVPAAVSIPWRGGRVAERNGRYGRAGG